MSLQQQNPVVPPQASDRLLRDFSQVIQGSFSALFQAAHSHPIRNSFPGPNEGQPGDLYSVLVNNQYWLVAKVSKTQWVKFGPGTII